MARILLADDGIEFDGESPSRGPLGGVESSVVNLTRELAARGHEVFVRNKCLEPRVIDGVDWAPLDRDISQNMPQSIDLYIANRGDKLLNLAPNANQMVFWIHNPARYLKKWRYLFKLWRLKPPIIFLGDYHVTTYPSWAAGGERIVIPYGISEEFRTVPKVDAPPPPHAIFTSNPLRSLDWLLDIWAKKIRPHVDNGELHIYSGSSTYGRVGEAKSLEMAAILNQAKSMENRGVVLRDPVPKEKLIEAFSKVRAMLYKGDENETFCLAVGEAQAAGVPAVVRKYGSVVERVKHGVTGTAAENDNEFAASAIKLLNDDDHWRQQHEAAQLHQRSWDWSDAAEAFERLIK